MLKAIWNKKRKRQGGFTLIELVVVLAILGILIALAVPRYLGARRNALVAEGQNVLQELKTLGWAYYQQYGSWLSLATGPIGSPNPFGFSAPGSGCWTYEITVATAASITYTANDDNTTVSRCNPLPGTATITLTLNSDGSSSTQTSL